LTDLDPQTVTYQLTDVLDRIDGKLDKIDGKLDGKADRSEVAALRQEVEALKTAESKREGSDARRVTRSDVIAVLAMLGTVGEAAVAAFHH
jgi:hypothetical protein